MAHPFLSDEWLAAARDLRRQHRESLPQVLVSLKAQLDVTGAPFGDGTVVAHIDTSSGHMEIEPGPSPGADLRITASYGAARALLVGGRQEEVVEALMDGSLRVEGDLAKLTALSSTAGSSGSLPEGFTDGLRAITA